MRIAHLSVMAGAALVTFVAGSSAITSAQPRRAATASTAPLVWLSERDLSATRESGCECTFGRGRRTLVQAIGHDLTLRTAAGRHVCRITDGQFGMISGDRATIACAGMRLSFRRTGRVRSHMASDSAEWPASLTLTRGRTQRTIAGNMGCAC